MNGIERIQEAFARTQVAGRAALMPYYTLGYPDRSTCLEVIEAVISAGADLLELGMPFSDPLADGPTIQYTTQVALEAGMTVAGCIDMVRELRARKARIPLLLMGYYNPLLNYGIERFVDQASEAGVDGLIVPDLPVDEADALSTACSRHGLSLVFLLAPNSTQARVQQVIENSTSFVYLVSLTGVTGARETLANDLGNFIQRVRQQTDLPLAVGFGVSTPQQARAVGTLSDGVIVGSALINAVRDSAQPVEAARAYAASLSQAISAQVEPQG